MPTLLSSPPPVLRIAIRTDDLTVRPYRPCEPVRRIPVARPELHHPAGAESPAGALMATDTPRRVGTFTPRSGRGVGYDLTLIEAEVLGELTLSDGHRLGYAEARRNIVTQGIDLNTLVGLCFRIGEVDCLG
jgi:hypothetical protein